MTQGLGYALPPRAFRDPAWFDAEQRLVFGGQWGFVAHAQALAEPGTFRAVQLGPYALLLVRDRRGVLRAFHNLCRHRGAPLKAGAGRCASLTCPYHRWSFGLDGALRGVPQAEAFPELDREALGLFPAAVGEWHGLLFAHPDPNPPQSLDAALAGTEAALAPFEPGALTLLHEERFTFAANWKLYVENHIDWLHLWYLHEDTLGAFDHPRGEITLAGPHWMSFETLRGDAAATGFGGVDEGLAVLPSLARADPKVRGIGAHYVFPNLLLFSGERFFMSGVLQPLGPQETAFELQLYGVAGGDPEATLAAFYAITKDEDIPMIESLQGAMAHDRFVPGPLAQPWEDALGHFHQHLLAVLEGAAS
ncbi:MAG: aromatic ring-hydroxylating dioxygenase subunit alpha [Pseudomonadales bacterium]|nr:aromatic ring-hydroxylating dioxygenase subunit alpha [Pseudomonadales bacterium]